MSICVKAKLKCPGPGKADISRWHSGTGTGSGSSWNPGKSVLNSKWEAAARTGLGEYNFKCTECNHRCMVWLQERAGRDILERLIKGQKFFWRCCESRYKHWI